MIDDALDRAETPDDALVHGETTGDALVLIGEDEPDNQVILQTVVEMLVGARAEVAGAGLAVLASV